MKRLAALCLIACLLLPRPARAQLPRLGLCMYSGRDTFINSLTAEMEHSARGRAELAVHYAQQDQNRQNDQVRQLLEEGVDVLLVNPVDRTSAVYLIRLARQHGVPIVLINRQPLTEDLDSYARAYYVGIDPKQQGRLQGELAVRYFQQHPQADLNGDGRIQLVLLRGEPGHQDAELRSLYAISRINRSPLKAVKLAEETASWDKALAQERMGVLLGTLGGGIECVLANNDDMALGAIDALKAAGYFSGGRSIPVIGVDATAPAMEQIAQGRLYATVRNDAQAQAKAALDLALLLAQGRAIDQDSYPFRMEGKVVYVASEAVTREGE